MDDVRDFGIAVADAIRLNDCFHELNTAFCARPLVDGDEDLSKHRQFLATPDTPEHREWLHRVTCQEVAQQYIRAAILKRDFSLWIRIATGDEKVDPYAIITVDHRTISAGAYHTFSHPKTYLEGRPLWVKAAEWRRFFERTNDERYGQPVQTTLLRAPSVKKGRPPVDDIVLSKADEMHHRGMRGQDIAKHMRLEAGFENVATRDVRALIKGRYKQGRKKRTP